MSWLFLVIAILLDVVANIALKFSDGFRRKQQGILALLCIMAAFACLAQALQIIELSVAYAFWGAIGLCLTVCSDYFIFGQSNETFVFLLSGSGEIDKDILKRGHIGILGSKSVIIEWFSEKGLLVELKGEVDNQGLLHKLIPYNPKEYSIP